VRAIALLLLLLPIAFGCGKKKDEPGKPKTREQICDLVADQAEAMAKGLVIGLSSGKVSDEEMRELEAEMKDKRREMIDECMKWPDEAIDCIRRRDEGPKCTEIIEQATGQGPSKVPELPAGPAVAWRWKLPDRPRDILIGDGGVVFASTAAQRVHAISGGKELWSVSVADPDADALRLDDDGTLLVMTYSPTLIALDPATGAERWRLEMPKGEPDEDGYARSGSLRAWAPAGKDLLLALSDGRILRRPPGCKAARCLAPAGAVSQDEDMVDGDTQLYPMPDGRLFLHQFDELRGYDKAMNPLVSITGYDHFTGVTPAADGAVVAQIGDELVALDPIGCADAKRIWLPPPPRKTADEEPCEECVEPPPGCVLGRALPAGNNNIDGLHRVRPAFARHTVFVVDDDGRLHAREADRSLAVRWEAGIHPMGVVVADDEGGVLVHCAGPGGSEDETQVAICAVAPDGKPRWRTPLDVKTGIIFDVSSFPLGRRGDWVVGGYGEEIVVLKLR
jgi:outer membrane protein assembly factor BamB